jgi:hypothetical protein
MLPRTLIAALFVAVAATVASAQDAFENRFELGKRLGGGTYKIVYEVKGHPDLVLILVKKNRRSDTLAKEKAFLDELDAKGVPVAKILELGTFDGRVAGIQKRYEVSDRDVMAMWDKRWDILNENTLADADKISKALAAAKIDIEDPQYLVAKDGHVVLNDPMGILPMPEKEEDRKTFGLLRALKMDAHEAIDARKLLEHMKTIPGADDPRLAPYFRERIVDYIPWGNEKKANKILDALLHYLETGPTTAEAKRVAAAVRSGKLPVRLLPGEPEHGELQIHAGRSFFVMVGELLGKGSARLDGLTGLDGSVASGAHVLAFLDAKSIPEGVDQHPVFARSSELRQDPEKILESLLKSGQVVEAAEKARLTGVAKEILARPRPTTTTGITELLDRARERTRVEER